MSNLMKSDITVLKTLGRWNDDTIYGHHLHAVFSHKGTRVSVLVVASRLGYTQKYFYYYRWVKTDCGNSYPTSEFYEDHQPSLRSCVSKVKAWQKEHAL